MRNQTYPERPWAAHTAARWQSPPDTTRRREARSKIRRAGEGEGEGREGKKRCINLRLFRGRNETGQNFFGGVSGHWRDMLIGAQNASNASMEIMLARFPFYSKRPINVVAQGG